MLLSLAHCILGYCICDPRAILDSRVTSKGVTYNEIPHRGSHLFLIRGLDGLAITVEEDHYRLDYWDCTLSILQSQILAISEIGGYPEKILEYSNGSESNLSIPGW